MEGRATSIKEESCLFQAVKIPSLEDLTALLNDLNDGTVPQYMLDNGYKLLENFTATFSYSYGNTGFVEQSVYGVFQKERGVTSHSTLDFRFFNGAGYSFTYTVGQALFTYTIYTKGEDSLVYEALTLGALMAKMPDGKYHLYGHYTGLTDGKVMMLDETISNQAEIVGIAEEPKYYTRDIVHVSKMDNSTDLWQKTSIFSTTGGTNSTLVYTGKTPPEGNVVPMHMKGNLANSEKDATVQAQGTVAMDVSKPFSDQNLPWIFSSARAVTAIYL